MDILFIHNHISGVVRQIVRIYHRSNKYDYSWIMDILFIHNHISGVVRIYHRSNKYDYSWITVAT